MKLCPKCNNEHDMSGKFCSRQCANSRVHSQETKDKIKKSVFLYRENNAEEVAEREKLSTGRTNRPGKKSKRKISTCPACSKDFEQVNSRNNKYCSPECRKSGGYREGSGRSKSGYYKGIYCASTYELVWIIYNIDHQIKFEKFQGKITDGNINYYPDFIIGNCIKEIKGYNYDGLVDNKCEIAISCGYEIDVLYKDDLKYAFEYVYNKYNTKILESLYDNYKPRYEYVCHYCKSTYVAKRKKMTEITYCSRQCTIKGNHRGNSP